jgi:hypothetical protein
MGFDGDEEPHRCRCYLDVVVQVSPESVVTSEQACVTSGVG